MLCKGETAYSQAENEYPRQNTMKRPMQRRCCRRRSWWVAGKGIHGKHPGANQTKASDTLEQREPDSTAHRHQEPIPASSREYQQDTVDNEIDLLHPAARTQAQRANRLLESIIACSRNAFQQVGSSEEECPDGTTAYQPKREWRSQAFLPTGGHVHLLDN